VGTRRWVQGVAHRTRRSRRPRWASHHPSIYAQRGAAGVRVLTDTGEDLFCRSSASDRPAAANQGATASTTSMSFLPTTVPHGLYASAVTGTMRTPGADSTARNTSALSRLPTPTTTPTARGASTPRASTAGCRTTLHWRRAHSVGHTAQDSDLLRFGLGMNALSWHRHRRRNGMPAAA
jgi:hypothetical protein